MPLILLPQELISQIYQRIAKNSKKNKNIVLVSKSKTVYKRNNSQKKKDKSVIKCKTATKLRNKNKSLAKNVS